MPQDQQQLIKKISQLKLDYERVFSSPDGKKVLEDIMRSGCVKRTIFSSDPLEMARDAGKQEFALHIQFMADPQPEQKEDNQAIT